MNKALDLLREIRPSIPKEVLELWCKDRDAFLASHPAVEQAGGDERAAFEAWATHLPMDRQPLRPDLYMPPTQWAWEAWQFRAALAQPSPAQAEQAEVKRLREENANLILTCASLDSEKREMQHKWDAIIAERDAALARVAELEKATMTESKICTCPSGDGSLRWPCPEHPAVEQAGGDERAAFEAWLAQAMSKKFEPEFDLAKYEDSGEYRYSPAAAYWKAWQARAALAQPSPAQPEGAPVIGCLCGMPMTEGHHSPDGCCNLEEFAPQAQADQAEAERPIVSFEKYMQVMYDRDENAKRLDAALARIAELEKQEPVATVAKVPGEDWNSLDFHRDLQHMQPGTKLYAAPVAQAQQLHDLDKQCRDDVARALGLRPNQERGFAWSYLLASIKSCVKASGDSAQAQHSVPVVTPEMVMAAMAVFRLDVSPFKSMEAALIAALRKAAAPGKEVGHE
ncbi:hypothetical protein JQS51_30405 [Pseudomonas aeruginosa]|uniref:hypothetical protein n=1 Tax=Pseudomonas aeruginosa TaxID=287 RepID=UPI00193B6490|nr:hypothetical protein [Pseudomonas aeruginosa]MBM2500586.1 hypothetical protein [Pseudomonas aeruginosa]